MSRVYYSNDTITAAKADLSEVGPALYDLEQSMGWNLRCADPENGPYHEVATKALCQILDHIAKVRRLLNGINTLVNVVEAEVVAELQHPPERKESTAAETEAAVRDFMET